MVRKLVLALDSLLSHIKFHAVHRGKNVAINLGTIIRHPEHVYIGEDSYINGGMLSAGPASKIVIGKKCLISYNVHLRTETHKYLRKDVCIKDQGCEEKDIIIGDDVWLGYGAQVLPGVAIGSGAVVGAGAIVTRNVPPYAIVAGVPARQLGERQ